MIILINKIDAVVAGRVRLERRTRGWPTLRVLIELAAGVALGIFTVIETKVTDPVFRLKLFRIRAFTAGNLAQPALLARPGGLMFMLIIWPQGIGCPSRAQLRRDPL